jgi:hypothetical protein
MFFSYESLIFTQFVMIVLGYLKCQKKKIREYRMLTVRF